MSMLSVCLLLSAIINKIESAPKLGNVLFDPLSYDAKLTRRSNELNDSQEDWLEESLRMPAQKKENKETTTKKPCLGYDYDETLCKTIDDRIICGYNKNKGNISDKIADLGNGCRTRGGRLECGYIEGPFNNPRRPPARDEINVDNDKQLNLRHGPTRTSRIPTQLTNSTKNNNVTLNVTLNQTKITKNPTVNRTNSSVSSTKKIKVISSTATSLMNSSSVVTSPHMNLSSISRRQYNATKLKRYCVEKNDRIFCYFIKQ